MGIRIFSLEEANNMLPDLSRRLEDLRSMYARIMKEQDRMAVFELIGAKEVASAEHSEYMERKRATSALVSDFESKFRRIQSVGCWVKDVSRGLVDFYSVRNGRLIFFCWELGEKEIRYWHELNTGYSGRKPIAELYDS